MDRRVFHSISLFSNCGAGDIGYARAGFQFDVMAELDARRLEVCLLNHPSAVGIAGDLRETWPQVIKAYRKRARACRPTLLAACPPCQGMSTARSDRGIETDPDAGMRDNRNLLVTVIAQVAKELLPHLIVVENVQAFLSRQVRHPDTNEPISAARLLIEELREAYVVYPLLADLCHFGVPQTRKRTFLTFIHRDQPAIRELETRGATPYPAPSHIPQSLVEPITVKQALAAMKLPSLDAGSKETAGSNVASGLHTVPFWHDRRYAMVAAIPPGSGRSAWQNNSCEACGPVHVGADDVLCPQCMRPLLRPVVEDGHGEYRLVHGFRSSTYSRMRCDRPAATITTASGHIGSNHTIHPYENRLFSPLECALLQTLPRNFTWGDALKKWGHTNVREMIGEAVPPLFTWKHGRVLSAVLRRPVRVRMLNVSDQRHIRARKKLGLSVPTVK